MAYETFLRRILAPLRIYDLDGGYGAIEIACEGEALDGVYDRLERLDGRRRVETATQEELSEYEELLPYPPISKSISDRRAAVAAMLGSANCCMTLPELNRVLPLCGVKATAQETDEAYTLRIVFDSAPEDASVLAEVKRRLGEILPCHLALVYS